MKISELSRIGRHLDPKYPTNIAIVALSGAVGIAAGLITLFQGEALLAAMLEAIQSGGVFFVGWVLAREYDPDHPYSAFLAAFGMLSVHVLGYTASLLFLALLVLLMRYINRSTGLPATTIDLAAGILLIAWLAWTKDWMVAVIGAGGFAIDGTLSRERTERYIFSAIALVIAAVSSFGGGEPTGFSGINPRVINLSIAFIVLSLPLYLSYRQVDSTGDLTEKPLEARRVRWGQIFYIAATVLIGLKEGIAESGDMVVAGSVIAATAIYYALSVILPGFRRSAS